MSVVRRILFPGGTRTRYVQGGTIAIGTWMYDDRGHDVGAAAILAAIWSIFTGWAAFIGISALDARNTIQYITSGRAGYDAIREAT